jgi:hypothetical protein
MPISDVDNVLLLIQRIGDVDPITAEPVSPIMANGNGIVMINSDRIWNKYSFYLSINPAVLGAEIFDHYFLIVGSQLVTAVLAERISFAAVGTAVRVDLSDRWKHHKAQMDAFQQTLDQLWVRASSYQANAALAPIVNVMPIEPPLPGALPTPLWALGKASPFGPDANNYVLAGSPYWSQWRRW